MGAMGGKKQPGPGAAFTNSQPANDPGAQSSHQLGKGIFNLITMAAGGMAGAAGGLGSIATPGTASGSLAGQLGSAAMSQPELGSMLGTTGGAVAAPGAYGAAASAVPSGIGPAEGPILMSNTPAPSMGYAGFRSTSPLLNAVTGGIQGMGSGSGMLGGAYQGLLSGFQTPNAVQDYVRMMQLYKAYQDAQSQQ